MCAAKRPSVALILLLFLLCALGPDSGAAAPETPAAKVVAVRVEGIIGPATSDFVRHGLDHAQAANAGLVVIEMDTPGGLDTSMRAIIRDILASPVPIATYVSPGGARAASAGTYILYASHIAAMAPATNVGAATPVEIGAPGIGKPDGDEDAGRKPAGGKGESGQEKDGKDAPAGKSPRPAGRGDTMMEKVENDAAAYLRSLAQLRGRDPDFAERAVREAASLSAEEALKANVIDLVASDLKDLLARLDGREVKLDSGNTVRLATAGAEVERLTPDWRNRILSLLSNPQLALVLMMIGIYGLFFEFTSPGFGVPGVAGLICLLIALYAFHLLPVNWAGVALIAIGATLMLAEAFLPSFGALGVGGIVAFIVGGLFLIDSEAPGFGVPLPFLIALAVASAALLAAVGGLAARTHRRPVVSGRESLVGSLGLVTNVSADAAWARVQGESWRVAATRPLVPGEQVRVVRVDGLTLQVEPVATSSSPNRSDRGGEIR
jgi:membrane-bound serine protease (ClpP class)